METPTFIPESAEQWSKVPQLTPAMAARIRSFRENLLIEFGDVLASHEIVETFNRVFLQFFREVFIGAEKPEDAIILIPIGELEAQIIAELIMVKSGVRHETEGMLRGERARKKPHQSLAA